MNGDASGSVASMVSVSLDADAWEWIMGAIEGGHQDRCWSECDCYARVNRIAEQVDGKPRW